MNKLKIKKLAITSNYPYLGACGYATKVQLVSFVRYPSFVGCP